MDFLTLSQLNRLISKEIENAFPEVYWLMAETSDVRVSNRHCYLEFVEKNPKNNNIIAKARAYIWANTFEILRPYFEEKTGQSFTSGLKILVKVSVEFHPVYGYGLNIYDIDPTYTLGDLQRRRQEILNQLEEEGILTLNKELEMPLLPQRIAVISSLTAAGYEDFLKHLQSNSYGFVFYTHLFPAIMQGEQTESSIISALDRIFENQEKFDVVIIIRGGGASSDLASFDSYLLAVNCAQFPLPIITGIGHERDETVLDFIANQRAKTPTAVADLLVSYAYEFTQRLEEYETGIINAAYSTLEMRTSELQRIETSLSYLSTNWIETQKSQLDIYKLKIQNAVLKMLSDKELELDGKRTFFKLSSPEYILSKGYSITLKDGKSIKSSDILHTGDEIETVFSKGRVKSIVKAGNKSS